MVKMRRRTLAIQVHPCAAGLVGSFQKALGGPPNDPVIETNSRSLAGHWSESVVSVARSLYTL